MQRATGLRSGDVVLQINRAKIAGAEDLRRAFSTAAGGGAVTVWFERGGRLGRTAVRSEEHTSELQSQSNLVCRLLLEKKKKRSSSPRPHLRLHTKTADCDSS